MLKLTTKWGHIAQDFRRLAAQATHPREYERWTALALVAEGKRKDEVAALLNRSYATILNWIDRYNEEGVEGLTYHPPPGQPSWLSEAQAAQLRQAMLRPPAESGLRGSHWTRRQVMTYCQREFQLPIRPTTANTYIRELGFVRKRPRQRYAQGDPQKKEPC